jgi:hypothetical protein
MVGHLCAGFSIERKSSHIDNYEGHDYHKILKTLIVDCRCGILNGLLIKPDTTHISVTENQSHKVVACTTEEFHGKRALLQAEAPSQRDLSSRKSVPAVTSSTEHRVTAVGDDA